MLCCNLSEVVDNSFYQQIMCQTFWQMLMAVIKMNKLHVEMNGKMLSIADTGKALLAWTVASFATINKKQYMFFLSSLMTTSLGIAFYFFNDM